MTSKALLLVMMEPPSTLEEEFNDWYDTEHFPQRRAMPGFASASRWVCVEGWPRYVALYDLESTDALRSDAYLAASGPQSTPWSKRILPRTCGRRRVIATTVAGGRPESAGSPLCHLLIVHYPRVDHPSALLERAVERLQTRHAVAAIRGFAARDGDATSLWLTIGFGAPVSAMALHEPLGTLEGHGADLFNLYVPYARSTS